MTDHTPEPWSRNISAKYPIYHEWTRPDGRRDNRKVAAVLGGDEQAEADLRRIVACVNACAGLHTAELERIASLDVTLQRVTAMRDAILKRTSGGSP